MVYYDPKFNKQNQSFGGRNPMSNQNQEPSIDLNFLNEGFLVNNNIKHDICDKHAKYVAEFLKDANKNFSATQLRRLYNDIKSIEARVTDDFESGKYLLSMLKAKVAYAVGRGSTTNFPKGLKIVIEKSVDRINNSSNPRKEFDGFVHFFEAIVGYFTFVRGGK